MKATIWNCHDEQKGYRVEKGGGGFFSTVCVSLSVFFIIFCVGICEFFCNKKHKIKQTRVTCGLLSSFKLYQLSKCDAEIDISWFLRSNHSIALPYMFCHYSVLVTYVLSWVLRDIGLQIRCDIDLSRSLRSII